MTRQLTSTVPIVVTFLLTSILSGTSAAGLVDRITTINWSSGQPTPEGYVSYQLVVESADGDVTGATVTATKSDGKKEVYTFSSIPPDSWFHKKFGEDTEPVKQDDEDSSGGGLVSRTTTITWSSGQPSPQGYVSYQLVVKSTDGNVRGATVTATKSDGKQEVNTFSSIPSDSWFHNKFGEDSEPVKQDDEDSSGGGVHPASGGVSVIRTLKSFWYSGGLVSEEGYVGYNYTGVFHSSGKPPDVTVIAVSKDGSGRRYTFDKIPEGSWFRKMFGGNAAIPEGPTWDSTQTQPATSKPVHTTKPPAHVVVPPPPPPLRPPAEIGSSGPPRPTTTCQLPVKLPVGVGMSPTSGHDDKMIPGSYINFSCNSPNTDELVGASRIVCNDDGRWSSVVPTCRFRENDVGCGTIPSMVPVSFGGKPTEAKKWPWHVKITSLVSNVTCGGCLIRKQWILTAAHCIDQLSNAADRRISLTFIADDNQVYPDIITPNFQFKHHHYESSYLDYDVGLLKMPEVRRHLHPICLQTKNADVNPNDEGVVTGYGATDATLAGSKVMQQLSLSVITNSQCQEVLNNRSVNAETVTERMFCGKQIAGSGHICSGDSGGPFMMKKGHAWTQFGVVSWAESQACQKTNMQFVSGFVRISTVIDWIHTTIKTNS